MKEQQEITAQDILDLWDYNEKTMGEQAALHIACEMLGISHERAMNILWKSTKQKRK